MNMTKVMTTSTRAEGGIPALGSAITWIERTGGLIAGLCIFTIMLVVFVDVLFRYLLNSPMTFPYDLIGIYLLPASFFFSLSETFRLNHHIAVDIFYLKRSHVTKRVFRLIAAVLSLGVFVPIAWLALDESAERFQNNDVIGGSILWPTWIPSAFVFLGFLLLVLRLAVDGLALVVAIANRTSDVAGESPERSQEKLAEDDAL